MKTTTLFRTRVPSHRLKTAEAILADLGLNPGDAFNMLLAQIERHQGLPFAVRKTDAPLLSADEQGDAWKEALGAY